MHVQINGKATNLHGVWDYEIIAMKNIVAGDCLALKEKMSASELEEAKKLNVFQWFNESRAEVEPAYKIGADGVLDQKYIDTKNRSYQTAIAEGGHAPCGGANAALPKRDDANQ